MVTQAPNGSAFPAVSARVPLVASINWGSRVWRGIAFALAALGQVWIDAIDLRRGALRPDQDARSADPDEDLRMMTALYCATFH